VGRYPWASAFWTDVRQTVAPPAGAKDGLLPPMLVGLTVVTGLVDSFSYLVLGHVFVANMTGNVVFFAFALAGVSGFSVTASVVAVGCFALAGRPLPAGLRYALIVALSLAMGVQNATARKLAVPDLTTTVLTLTITGIAADSPIAGATGAHAARRLISVAAMLVGALAGALLVLRVHIVYPLVIALVILAAVTVFAVTWARKPRTSRYPAT
jgi:uncharacterized membrane protein YoaK (UPF0700 family)